MHKNFAHSDLLPEKRLDDEPVGLCGVPPIVKAEYDGEGGSGQ